MKKKISLVVAGLLLVSVLLMSCTSCASQSEDTSSDTLTMATNATFPPYEYVEGDGYAGIDVEIAQAIAEKLGKTLEIADIDFGAIVAGVQTGKYDIGMAGMTVTDERKESVNFSNSYATGVQSVIVAADSEYTSFEEFYAAFDDEGNPTEVKDGIIIGVQQDTTGDIYCSDDPENWGFGESHVVRYKSGTDAVQALKSGKVTAVIIDNEPAKSYVADNDGLKILDGVFVEEEYAIAIAKENTQLLEDVNKALDELTADGTIQQIVDKYISAD